MYTECHSSASSCSYVVAIATTTKAQAFYFIYFIQTFPKDAFISS